MNEGKAMTDERELINRAQRGDMESFRLLVESARVNVFRLAYDLTSNRHDAEDLSQEVFLKAYRSLNKFRGDSKWSSWLYRITVNSCYDHHKSGATKVMKKQEEIENSENKNACHSTNIAPDKITDSSIIQENIEKALKQLTPRERSVFVLRHYHDLSLKQIAKTLEIADGTVKTLLFRALQKLQQELAFYKKDLGLEGK
ncbi:MAG: RNA polymerase sigma factor [Ignavibacteriales bacterium]|nr:RNA polymerase sigma factor [Ignavibacteriales bacterium]